jgi:gamma-glutamyltranspeptidase/glutathione hydrolase
MTRTGRPYPWAVATPHGAASDAAAAVLRAGGNAVDGALAAAAVLTVVYPNQCSIGGDQIALVGLPDGTVHCVDGSGAAALATELPVLAARYRQMPVEGGLAVTVPGVLHAWDTMSNRWGTRDLADALDTARTIADQGVPVAAGLARDLVVESQRLAADPGLSQMFVRDGQPLTEGDQLRQPALAGTLQRLRDDGVAAFYDGPVGAAVLRRVQQHGSDLSADDLRRHRTRVVAPLSVTYRRHDYLTAPPSSQGAFFLGGLLALAALESALGRQLDPLSDDAGIVARVLSTLAWDRDRRLGDAADSAAVVERALSPSAAEELARAVLSTTTGVGHDLMAASPGSGPRSGDTVAVVVTDGRGQWVSLIQSTFHAFGSGILDPDTGIILHNRGASFSLDPRSPNRLGPGRVPLHTLMPVLVRQEDELVGAHGTMGGRAQPQVHTHVAMHVEAGRSPESAVAMPRWILGAMEAGVDGPEPSLTIKAENDVPESALAGLRAAGFSTSELPPHDDGAGHFQLVRVVDGDMACASDPRADGSALVG